jgi:hypothetical protein
MNNKNVIRKKTKSGEFTTIHNSILFDTRLTPIAFRLLTAILSDSDDFKLSQTLYMRKLGLTENRAYLKAISNLESCGYLKKTEISKDKYIPFIKKINSDKKVFKYTISEYGNLMNENIVENESRDPKLNNQNKERLELNKFIELNATVLGMNEFIFKEFEEVFNRNCIEIDKYKSIIENEKNIQKKLKEFFKERLNDIQINIKPNQNKSVEEFKDWLKHEIFDKRNFSLTPTIVRSKYAHIALIKNKKTYSTDLETQMGDYYENPKD